MFKLLPLTAAIVASCSLSSATISATISSPRGDDDARSPVELGRVTWGRDVDRGLDAAESADKPVLLLFQEIPG